MKIHRYETTLRWNGNTGAGTSGYSAYSRNHEIDGPGKAAPVPGSSDSHFRGDGSRYNPEELLVASLSSCHMLWYLHLCAVNGIVVTHYEDAAAGFMHEADDGAGRFEKVMLRPAVTISSGSDRDKAQALHREAHRMCFIANSVNFPVMHEASVSYSGMTTGLPLSTM